MNDPAAEPRVSSVVKCEKHGLHYDSSKTSGCVICRRESGGGAVVRLAPPAPAAASGSLGQALAVTAVLLVLATAALFCTHGFMIEALKSDERPAAGSLDEDFDRQMEDMGLPPGGQAGGDAEGD